MMLIKNTPRIIVPLFSGDEAHGGTNENQNQQQGERATAVMHFINNISERTAGGTYLGNDALTDAARELAKLPENYLQYMTVPGISYTVAREVWSLGKNSAVEVATTINNNPQLKQKIKTFTKTIIDKAGDVMSKVTTPINSALNFAAIAPYLIMAAMVAFVVFAFKNPGSVSTPRKVSLY